MIGQILISLRAALMWALLAVATALPASAEIELVMAETAGCKWCEQWNEDVATEYPFTAEGRAAPLRRIEMNAPLPDDLKFEGAVRYTPTFVLVRNGQEVARLEGYPGEDFFWGLLRRMLGQAGVELDQQS